MRLKLNSHLKERGPWILADPAYKNEYEMYYKHKIKSKAIKFLGKINSRKSLQFWVSNNFWEERQRISHKKIRLHQNKALMFSKNIIEKEKCKA